MALLSNGYRGTLGATQFTGATIISNSFPGARIGNWHRTAAMRNFAAGEALSAAAGLVSFPSGNRHPNVWMMPQKPGALAARNSLVGEGEVSGADVWAVKLAEAAISGSGELTAFGGLIVQLIAAITGSGTVSNGDLKAFLQAVASIGGSGAAGGTITAFGELVAALSASGTAGGSTLSGLGELSADLVVTGSGLTTANVGQAVWDAIASANNSPGTMGEKLNDAGSASNPWTEIIESGYSAAEILRIVAAVLAGKVSGAGTGTETFVGIDGTTDRVVSTVDNDGNRTAVVLDGS